MSREFGSCGGGYFHTQIEEGAEDCISGREKITKLWGAFLKEFSHVAYSISNCEACDSGAYDPIFESMVRMPLLQQKLRDIEIYLEPFQRVSEVAVEQAARKEKETANPIQRGAVAI